MSIVCMPLAAQETHTETSSGVAEQFKRLDRDGNGRLSASEAGKAEFFRRTDDRRSLPRVERWQIQADRYLGYRDCRRKYRFDSDEIR